MKTYLDCYSCFLRQALKCVRMSSEDISAHKEVMNRALKVLRNADRNETPPEIAKKIYGEIKKVTGEDDPYRKVRKKDNKQMMEIYHEIRQRVDGPDALFLSCLLSAGGNIIDSGAGKRKDNHGSRDIDEILKIRPAVNDFNKLREMMEKAKMLLFIGDNAGEIVMDKLFISFIREKYPDLNIVYAVRGEAVINDAIMEDALETGVNKLCRIISNGDLSPGTDMESCCDEFRKIYSTADIIIAKGQGNYETLSGRGDEKIFFLLRAKCSVVARHLGVESGALVIKQEREEVPS